MHPDIFDFFGKLDTMLVHICHQQIIHSFTNVFSTLYSSLVEL